MTSAMRMHRAFLCLAIGLVGLAAAPTEPADDAPATTATEALEPGITYIIPIHGPITPSLTFVIRRGVRRAANDDRVRAIIFDMDTPGGRLDTTEQIIRQVQNVDARTYTFVNPSAYSAGAIIAMATDRIYMAPNSRIGDAMPIMVSPLGGTQEMPEALQEKMVSAVAAMIRGAAQHKGHDPQLAEAMVRREMEYIIDGEVICKAGELLTLTNIDAGRLVGPDQRPLLSLGTVADVETLMAVEGLDGTRVVELKVTPAEVFARWIESLSFIFLAGGLIGLYIEIRTPGFGFPGIAGVLLLAIWFWGHHIAGLSGLFELTLFLVGFGLVMVEIFLIPGFGLAGGTGLVLMLVAIVLSMVDLTTPSGPILPRDINILRPVNVLLATLLITGVGIYLVTMFLPKLPLFRRLILESATDRASGYQASDDTTERIGQQGIALTALRPAGTGLFDDQRLDVVSRGDFIDAKQPITIVETHGNRMIVERLPTENA